MPRQWSIEQIEAYKDKQAAATKGFAEAAALFDALPGQARIELELILADIGRDVQKAQLARVPIRTGRLSDEIEVQVLAGQLKVRVGLLGPASKAKFYGRVINGGRRAQTVVVQRRRVGAVGLLRRGRKRVEDIVATYMLSVTALAPQPFIDLPEGELDAIATQRIADFWGRTIDRTGD